MAKREPTIEQNSHFSAKTKQGQDVEFEATLKFYITPSGEVTLSAPGGKQSAEAAVVVAPSAQGSYPPEQRSSASKTLAQESSASKTPTQESPLPKDPNAGRQEVGRSGSGVRLQPEKRALTDDTIDKAFPRGPEEPGSQCAIKQFIPDPCKAVDDAVKSIKGLYNNWFSGPKCPPPENTDNKLSGEYTPLFNKSERDYSEKPAEVMNNEDNENKETLENEQKYDM